MGSHKLPLSPRIQRNANYIRALGSCTVAEQVEHIGKAKKDLLDALAECARHMARGEIQMHDKHFGELKKRRNKMRHFAHTAKTVRAKREVLQSGGFIGFLLKPLLGLLAGKVLTGITKGLLGGRR